MTGTGSGKTESFLLPAIGKLMGEASSAPNSFRDHRAVRTMILYPMNALVNDQLGRIRTLLGDARLKDAFLEVCGRIPTFARYTSRTPYPGVRDSKKDGRRCPEGKKRSLGKKGISLRDLAAVTQVKYAQILAIEKGQSNATILTLIAITSVLDVNLCEVLNFKEGEKGKKRK